MSLGAKLAERGLVPDPIISAGIRGQLRGRLREEQRRMRSGAARAFFEELPVSPVAIHTKAANDQHYEVPGAYFERVLGPRMKYSCCLFERPGSTLEEAEVAMLRLTAQRAGIQDGMQILDLGCGWGSLALWLAECYPKANITAVSNSTGQRLFIERRAHERGLANLSVITADVNDFAPNQRYDRVVSIEMFEHLRNHEEVLRRIRTWLKPGGALFVHIFCHREYTYPYETGKGNWMGQHFFTGGMMPSYDLLTNYNQDLRVEQRWQINGRHYYQTCMHWLARHDAARSDTAPTFAETYGPENVDLWHNRWRLFYLACAELFRYNQGNEWFVAHYRLVEA